MLITACMIVRNEAAALPRALHSLRGHADEIVVVDTGSTDGTQALCRDAGCTLIEEPWRGSFSAPRNTALAAARGRFCLMIDGDEEVEAATWPSLLRFLEEDHHPLGRIWQVSDTADGVVREAVTRVCKNDGRFRYEGRVHEQLVQVGAKGDAPPPSQACLPCERSERRPGDSRGDTGLNLLHSGYTKESLARKRTAARNLELLRLDLQERPADAYVLYQIGRTLWQEHPAEAVRHFEQALSSVPPDAPYLPGMFREMGYALRAAGRPKEALSLVRAALKRLPELTDLHFLLGLVHMDLGDAGAMVAAFQRCLQLGDPRADSVVDGVGSFRPHHNLGLFYELTERRDLARHHYREALRARPGFAPATERLAALDALDSTEARRGP